MKNQIKPIFILSLPRTGSTLLQRVLMSHSKISSFAEPHFLLPFIYANKKEGTVSSYSHISSYKAVSDVVKNLPNKENDYFKYLKDFSLKIYQDLSDDKAVYFLDKTPVYIWVIPEIMKIFPNAKFVFLFRNPIQVFSSVITTFSDSRFKKFYRFKRYLDEGFDLLSEKYEEYKDNSISIKYEDFVKNPEVKLKELLEYLELDHEENMLDAYKRQDLIGRSMDPIGLELYNKVEKASLEKWKKFFNTKYRVNILLKYIEGLDSKSLLIQGYDKESIMNEIKDLKPKRNLKFIKDFFDYNYTKLVIRYKFNVLFAENVKWSRDKFLS